MPSRSSHGPFLTYSVPTPRGTTPSRSPPNLAADAASYMLHNLIPADTLAATVRHAFLDEIADGMRLSGKDPADDYNHHAELLCTWP